MRNSPLQDANRIVAMVVALACGGCINYRLQANDFLMGYSDQRSYETRVPLILMWETDSGLGRRQALVVPPDAGVGYGGRLHSAPPASNPWGGCRSDDVCWNMGDIVAVVPAGTRLVVDRVERVHGWNIWYGSRDDLFPFATLNREGKSISVEISDLSRTVPRTVSGKRIELPVPDLSILQEQQ